MLAQHRRLPLPYALLVMYPSHNRAGFVYSAKVCPFPARLPSWLTRCLDPSFICNACESDTTKNIVFGYHDSHSHDLVRCAMFVEEVEVTLEDRLADLEQRFIQHEANMDQRLCSLEAKVDDRLLKVDNRLIQVEKLLERVLFALERPLQR